MVSLADLKAFLAGLVIGLIPGYLQGSETVQVVDIILASPVGQLLGGGYAFLQVAIETYGIWAFVAASFMKGLLLFVFAPAEAVTPLYIFYAAETGWHVAVIVIVGAAAITAANTVVYLVARLAGESLFTERSGPVWTAVEWVIDAHGRIAIFLLRLIPWIGGWAAIPAGIARMNLRDFIVFSFLGFLVYEAFLGGVAWYGVKQGMIPELAFLAESFQPG